MHRLLVGAGLVLRCTRRSFKNYHSVAALNKQLKISTIRRSLLHLTAATCATTGRTFARATLNLCLQSSRMAHSAVPLATSAYAPPLSSRISLATKEIQDLCHDAADDVGPQYGNREEDRNPIWKSRLLPLSCEACNVVCATYEDYYAHCLLISHRQAVDSDGPLPLWSIDPRLGADADTTPLMCCTSKSAAGMPMSSPSPARMTLDLHTLIVGGTWLIGQGSVLPSRRRKQLWLGV